MRRSRTRCFAGRWSKISAFSIGVLTPFLLLSRAELQGPPLNTITRASFTLAYDGRGITGISNPGDPYGAQFLAPGAHLGDPVVKYKTGDSEWADISTKERKLEADPENGSLVYSDIASASPLKLVQRFRTGGNSLDWTLEIEAVSKAPVQIGDLAIPIPWRFPAGENPETIFEK